MIERIPVSCNRDCGGGCPLEATVEDGRVTRIRNSPHAGPYMQGCIRGFEAARNLYAPDRLTTPLLRTGPRGSGQFRAIPWDEALDRVAEKLNATRDEHGYEAIMRLGGSGSCRGALHHTSSLSMRFFNLYGGCTYTYSSYSSAAASYATPFVLGSDPPGIDAGTLQHAQMIILWGLNVVDCRFGCELHARLREAKARGIPIVVIDPRASATVRELSTEWLPVRPGTDSALMLAMLYVMMTEGLVAREFVARYAVGFDQLERYVLGQDGSPAKTPAWAEALCGTPASAIQALARCYAATKPTALLPGLSFQRTWGGEEPVRLAIALQVATGNLGVLGGSSGALTWGRLPGPRFSGLSVPPPAPRSASVPVYTWADAVLGGKAEGYPSDVRLIYNVGGNYLVEGPDARKSQRAFEKVDLVVCHELFLTPTARYSDIVLPVTHWLERQDITLPGANYLLFSNRAVTPLPEARNDYDILAALAERLGFGAAFSEGRDEEAWLRHFVAHSDVPDYDEFKRTGLYMGADQMRVGLADFVADPAAHPLRTPSGRVELASEVYARTGYPAVPEARILHTSDAYPLRLVTPKSRYRVHSQNSNIPYFRAREEQALWINPTDARTRHIADGDLVTVQSAEGRVRISARVTEEIMPGVVCLLEGVWPTFDAQGVDTAGSANVLTSSTPTEPCRGSRTHSVLVEVTSAHRS
jgi:anaerobic dimethyl sulfoxide reductase subunit A